MITGNAKRIDALESCNTFCRLGIVADDVAEADDTINARYRNVIKHRLERRQIGVNIGDKREFHDPPFGRCKSGPSRARSRETVRHATGVCLMKRLMRRSATDRLSAGRPRHVDAAT